MVKLRALFYRILDRYYPVVCVGRYRLHHFHWKDWRKTEVPVKKVGSFSGACWGEGSPKPDTRIQRDDIYVCCRCSYERVYPGPHGPMVREDGNEIRRVG